MLPNLGVTNDAVTANQESIAKRAGIFNNISNSMTSSPKFFMQESLVNTLGNNFLTQGIMQFGSILSSIVDRVSGADSDIETEMTRQSGPGLSDLDRNILKEMLKTLLRIEKNTEGGNGVYFEPEDGQPSTDLEKIRAERRTAEDILARIKMKSPMEPLRRDNAGNLLHDHMGDIEQSVANTAVSGVYNAFGYNILTQGALDTVSLAGDIGSRLLDGMGGKKHHTNSANDHEFEERKIEEDSLVELKDSKTILRGMLDRLNEISDHFRKFFGVQDVEVSNLEDRFENGHIPSPAMPPKDKLAPSPAADNKAEKDDSLLSKAGNLAEIIHTMRDFKGVADKLGTLFAGVSVPALVSALSTAAMAAAPLAAMAWVVNEIENTAKDLERAESLKGVSEGISDFLKNFGIDFESRFDDIRKKNREGLDTTEELRQLEIQKKEEKAPKMEKAKEQLDSVEEKRKSIFQDGLKQTILNTTNINSQTIIPTRTTVRNTDDSANRYLDKSLK